MKELQHKDKELLLKDLCARLPYEVKIELMPITKGKCTTLTPIILRDYYISDDVNYLPYLRPMSSMTEEEKEEYHKLCDKYYDIYFNSVESIDWLNAHHFDYRGLIGKSLAIEAPKGMYNETNTEKI